MQIVILVYPGMTGLDVLGPYEVLSRLPDAKVRFVARQPGPVTTDTGMLTILAEAGIDEVDAADVFVVGGGPAACVGAVMQDRETLDWIARLHAGSRYTVSVCNGSWILGAAGVLEGKRAGCHWMGLEALAGFGAEACADRVVVDGKLWTAGGVTSGIDMALTFAAEVAGDDFAQILQLALQYDPKPPFQGGTPETAPEHILRAVQENASAVLG
jgi:putative intracellular protease/amidase